MSNSKKDLGLIKIKRPLQAPHKLPQGFLEFYMNYVRQREATSELRQRKGLERQSRMTVPAFGRLIHVGPDKYSELDLNDSSGSPERNMHLERNTYLSPEMAAEAELLAANKKRLVVYTPPPQAITAFAKRLELLVQRQEEPNSPDTDDDYGVN
jgi:hypothetical protein